MAAIWLLSVQVNDENLIFELLHYITFFFSKEAVNFPSSILEALKSYMLQNQQSFFLFSLARSIHSSLSFTNSPHPLPLTLTLLSFFLSSSYVGNGTDYCDITGETDWVREMIDKHDNRARETGSRIVHFCGHDCVPWDLAGKNLECIGSQFFPLIHFTCMLCYILHSVLSLL